MIPKEEENKMQEAGYAKTTDEQAKYYVDEPSGDVTATRGGWVKGEVTFTPDFQVGNVIDEVEEKEEPGGSTPSQYALPAKAKELQDLIEHRNMNFATGNIFKAIYRLGSCDHATVIYDLNIIIYFAEREKERQKKACI